MEQKINEHYALKNLLFKKILQDNCQFDQKITEFFNIFRVTKALSLSFSLNELLETMRKVIAQSLKIEKYCFALLDKEKQIFRIRDLYRLDNNRKTTEGINCLLCEKIYGKVFHIKGPILIKNIGQKNEFLSCRHCLGEISSLLSLPLSCNGAKGIWNIYNSNHNYFDKGTIEIFSIVAEHLAIAVNRANEFGHINELSIRDELTQLHNRRYFFDFSKQELELSNRYNRIFSIILIDVDFFKNYNDINGHTDGDIALKQTADILRNQVRQGDILARLGGDEFVILLPETSVKCAITLAEKLRQKVADTHYKGEENQPYGKFTITSGIASFPGNGDNMTKIIKSADKRMYYGKGKGRNIVCF